MPRRPAQATAERRRIRRLEAVVEAGHLVGSTLDLKAVAEYVVGIAARLIRAERGSLFLVDRERSVLRALVAQGVAGERLEVGLGEGIVGAVAASGEAIIIADPYHDPRFDRRVDAATGFRTRSLLTVPVRDREGATVAVLQLLNHRGRGFSAADVAFLAELGVTFAIALSTARLHGEIVARERAREELRVAAEIQRTLLPSDFTGVDGLEIAARFQPSFEVGGDYFDLIPSANGGTWLVVADVSGKGVAAGMVASTIQSFLWSRRRDGRPLPEVVRDGNEVLHHLTGGRKYATLVVAAWEPVARSLTWVNAGHPPLLLRRGGTIERHGSTGPPVGLLPSVAWSAGEAVLAPGDTLLLCTDGVLEAGVEADLDDFGVDRVAECMAREAVPDTLVAAVSAAVSRYLDGRPPHDDLTVLAARCR